ncbi:DUF4976 domain-containing protein [Akkermansiaceae bacterium]|nr:DUF4976 domain-containing protein [Akkermansiaceae bacterium]MDA7888055.1 DUF4976 domain-containing protein [Akkermansiaceae bacterium]MDB4537916.1 DUF4976 domain-containing protein [Akkermansiaceae bacterium]
MGQHCHQLCLYNRYASIRTKQFRYICYQDGQQELYDHENDPHKWKNEANNLKYAEPLKKLNRKLPAIEDMAKQLGEGQETVS